MGGSTPPCGGIPVASIAGNGSDSAAGRGSVKVGQGTQSAGQGFQQVLLYPKQTGAYAGPCQSAPRGWSHGPQAHPPQAQIASTASAAHRCSVNNRLVLMGSLLVRLFCITTGRQR
jgi:hypothetical protein